MTKDSGRASRCYRCLRPVVAILGGRFVPPHCDRCTRRLAEWHAKRLNDLQSRRLKEHP